MLDIRTSGALQARLIWVLWLDFVVYVARPVEFVCCDHLEVPKSPICKIQSSRSAPSDGSVIQQCKA